MKEKEFENEPVIGGEGLETETCEGQCDCETSDNMSEEGALGSDNLSDVLDQAAEWKDKYLRLVAEFDNYRKRTLREKMEIINNGGENVIKSILEVIDDVDRAVKAIEGTSDLEAAKEGVVLIYDKLMVTLRSRGVSEIEAMGQNLDTDLHEAVAKVPAEGEAKGKIIDVLQKGYKLNDKVMRYAKVVVGE